ncbi:hypothetical protein LIA77_05436 [Sarocladium implicatum]|nr:hypothetical protein LIA77_05436 [Sarocladium implicatum]
MDITSRLPTVRPQRPPKVPAVVHLSTGITPRCANHRAPHAPPSGALHPSRFTLLGNSLPPRATPRTRPTPSGQGTYDVLPFLTTDHREIGIRDRCHLRSRRH